MANINDYGFPFTSVTTDRAYGADEWRDYFASIFGNGVFEQSATSLKVAQSAVPAKSVLVPIGSVHINGAIRIIDVAETLAIADNTSGNPRIDRVVARLDYTDRLIELAVLQGTPAGSPSAPTLTQDATTWEISLAQIAVANGFSTIATAQITDERVFAKSTIRKRTFSLASSATPTPNIDDYEVYKLTALGADAEFQIPAGTPNNGQGLLIKIKDNGTARALTWNAIYRAIGFTLPATTVASKILYVGMVYDSTDTKWDVISVGREG